MATLFQPTAHPILAVPSAEQMVAMGPDKWREMMLRRETIIRNEKMNPLKFGWESSIWSVCDALVEFPWVDKVWAEKVRQKLGFDQVIKTLLILGGNRGSKTTYAAKRVMKLLLLIAAGRAWCFHESENMSKEYQQRLIHDFLPPEYRAGREIRSATTYIAYKTKTGFSEGSFVLPNLAHCSFRNYGQKVEEIEGGEIDVFWCDELVPYDWVETLELRLATRDGRGLITFTPKQGYTPTVKVFQDEALEVRKSIAFLLPRDGKPPIEDLAMQREDCTAWFEDGSGQPPIPEGRDFEMVPRIMKCVDKNKAIVFFHTSDNSFAPPANVLEKVRGKTNVFIKERWYGMAMRAIHGRFTKFKREVHLVKSVPTEGTNYMFLDPASGRNFFMTWIRVTPEGVYVYREWPGNYHIPGVGVPEVWALPDGRRPDGRAGKGQESFGWGLIRYKLEMARLEGWKDFEKYTALMKEIENGGEIKQSQKAMITEMLEDAGSREAIADRFVDSRFASSQRLEDDRPVTLLENFNDLGLNFRTTPGDDIDEGADLIVDALDYEADKPLDFFNKPHLHVHEDCVNTAFALAHWTGKDGRKGACKDPVDNLRYFFLSDCEYMPAEALESEGGGHY